MPDAQSIFTYATDSGILAAVLCFIRFILRFEPKLDRILSEHELLILDYCKRKKILLKELPTRLKNMLWK